MRMIRGALDDLRTVQTALEAIQATAGTEPRAEVLAGVIRAVEALEAIHLPPVPD